MRRYTIATGTIGPYSIDHYAGGDTILAQDMRDGREVYRLVPDSDGEWALRHGPEPGTAWLTRAGAEAAAAQLRDLDSDA